VKRTILIALLAAVTLLGAPFVHIDHYYGSYGVSIGSDTHYCSVDFPNGTSCEVAH
jgi:hypothetical protein